MDDDEGGLDLPVSDILKAFELAGPYAVGNSHCKKLQHRKELALGIIDWALMECDRGLRLLELTNEVERLTDELNTLRKGGGTYIVGPFGV